MGAEIGWGGGQGLPSSAFGRQRAAPPRRGALHILGKTCHRSERAESPAAMGANNSESGRHGAGASGVTTRRPARAVSAWSKSCERRGARCGSETASCAGPRVS